MVHLGRSRRARYAQQCVKALRRSGTPARLDVQRCGKASLTRQLASTVGRTCREVITLPARLHAPRARESPPVLRGLRGPSGLRVLPARPGLPGKSAPPGPRVQRGLQGLPVPRARLERPVPPDRPVPRVRLESRDRRVWPGRPDRPASRGRRAQPVPLASPVLPARTAQRGSRVRRGRRAPWAQRGRWERRGLRARPVPRVLLVQRAPAACSPCRASAWTTIRESSAPRSAAASSRRPWRRRSRWRPVPARI